MRFFLSSSTRMHCGLNLLMFHLFFSFYLCVFFSVLVRLITSICLRRLTIINKSNLSMDIVYFIRLISISMVFISFSGVGKRILSFVFFCAGVFTIKVLFNDKSVLSKIWQKNIQKKVKTFGDVRIKNEYVCVQTTLSDQKTTLQHRTFPWVFLTSFMTIIFFFSLRVWCALFRSIHR